MGQKHSLIDVLAKHEPDSAAGVSNAQQEYSSDGQRRPSPGQHTQLRLVVDVMEYVHDYDGVHGAKVGLCDVTDLKFCIAAQSAACTLDIPSSQFDSPERGRSRRREPFRRPKMRAFFKARSGADQPRCQQSLTTAEIQDPFRSYQ
jgi:hypothetical protein